MCSDPQMKDGNTFACRRCNECIAVRRSGWIARAMAEKTGHKHALCVALTYGEETQEQRDAAKVFCYADVRAFLARLRSALRRKGLPASVRFLCAGEQGDRNGRCHWHLILYSDADLTQIGDFTRYGRPVTNRADMMTVGKRKRRLHWSLWGNGFVTLQEPDQGGMAYVLSYCLKDQFTGENSKDTMREAKAENFATGLFRMSKRPAIGEDWLMRKLEGLLDMGAVLPALQLKIPDMSGYWHPNGLFREKLLWGLVALNQRILWDTGAPAPQWPALLAACRDNEKDMEILNGEKGEDHPDHPDHETLETRLARGSRENAERAVAGEIRGRCVYRLPCNACLDRLDAAALWRLRVKRVSSPDEFGWQYETVDGSFSVKDLQSIRLPSDGVNPHCQRRGEKTVRLLFPDTGGFPK